MEKWEKWKNVERRKLRGDTYPAISCILNEKARAKDKTYE
jgi:hypothetical protein